MGHIVRKAQSRVPDEQFLTASEKRLFQTVRSALNGLSANIDAEAMARAIVNLNPDLLNQVLTSVNLDDLQVAVKKAISDVLNEAGKNGVREIQPVISATPSWGNEYTATGKPNTELRFDINNPYTDLFADKQAGRLVTAITASVREGIREVISDAFKNQVTVDMTARRLRQIVGLHPRWALAVDRHYVRQYQNFRKQGLNHERALDKAEATTANYRNRLIRARAVMIARTEIQIAQNMGRQLAWQQASDGGWVDPVAEKVWQTASATMGGVPPCDRCAPMEGERVRWNESFSNGLLMPPAHPHCRCSAFLVPPSRGLNDAEYIRTGRSQ